MCKIVSFWFLLIAFTASAQKQGRARADSLLTLLASAKEDINKVKLYVNIIAAYNDFDRVEAHKYEKPAMELAAKFGPSAEADVKNGIGRVYWREGNFELALKYHGEARQAYEHAHNEDKVALTTRYIGQDYADGGIYPEALKYFSETLALYTRLGNKRNMAHAYELIAWVYRKQGKYVEASQAGYAMLRLFEEVGDKNSIALGASEIAENYILMGNYPEALKYFKKSDEVYRATGDRINTAYNRNLIGRVYRFMGNDLESLKCHEEALSIGKEVGDANVMANAYDGLADVYKQRKDYRLALKHYLSSAELFRKWSNRRDLARLYCKIGESYRIEKDYELARKYYDDAFTLSKELDSKSLVTDYYHGIEMLDSATGRWKEAYIHHKKYILHRDSIFNQENIGKMVQLKMNYEFDKKEAAAKAEQEEKDIRQQKQFLSLGIIAALVFILAVVLYRNQKRVARINLELKQKSEGLEEENREKTSILNIVSHDLKAPFHKIKGLADLMKMSGELSKTEKEEYLMHIQSAVQQGSYLISNLLESQTIYRETTQPVYENVDLKKFIHDFQQETNGQLFKKKQRLQTELEMQNGQFVTDPHMLVRILDNLVSNASKFSEQGKSIYLRVWAKDKTMNFSVRDEGPGISEQDQQKMFRKFQMLTAKPTAGEGSTGLGLSIIKALVEKMNGSIAVNSKLNEGTEMVISFPV